MRLTILSPKKDWEHIKEDLKRVNLMGEKVDYDIVFFPVLHIKTEEYLPGKYGLDRKYLSALTKLYAYADVVAIHIEDFPIKGAGGWFTIINGKPSIQLYGDLHNKYSRTGEFKYWFSELLAHELAHKYYRKAGLEDKTHYWHYEKGRLLGAFEDIISQLTKKKGLWEQIVILTRKLLNLQHQEEQVKELWAIHHSATPRDVSRSETIIKNSKKEYGKCFYDVVIDRDGIATYPESIIKQRGTKDICVIGNFVNEKPTPQQIETLKSIIEGHDYTTHKELAEKGLASFSECPGRLMDYIDL